MQCYIALLVSVLLSLPRNALLQAFTQLQAPAVRPTPARNARISCPLADTRRSSTRIAGAGKGFADKLLKEVQPQSQTDPSEWEREYKGFIKRCGAFLCALSWQGHEKMGRGAIYANYEAGKAAGSLSEAETKLGGIPSMYCPLEEFTSMKPHGAQEQEYSDLQQIIKRIKSYDPEREFVVVFQAAGVCGADICKPSVGPPQMAQMISTEAELEAADSQRVALDESGRLGIRYGVKRHRGDSQTNKIADAQWEQTKFLNSILPQ